MAAPFCNNNLCPTHMFMVDDDVTEMELDFHDVLSQGSKFAGNFKWQRGLLVAKTDLLKFWLCHGCHAMFAMREGTFQMDARHGMRIDKTMPATPGLPIINHDGSVIH